MSSISWPRAAHSGRTSRHGNDADGCTAAVRTAAALLLLCGRRALLLLDEDYLPCLIINYILLPSISIPCITAC
jgi:hypothetical protein